MHYCLRYLKISFIQLLSFLNFFKVDFFEILYRLTAILTGRNRSYYNIGHEFKSVLKFIDKVNIFVDVGANKGLYSDFVYKHNSKASIFIVETDKRSFSFLKSKYSKKENIKLFNIALGSEKKRKNFYSSYKSGLNSYFNRKFQLDSRVKNSKLLTLKFKKNFNINCLRFLDFFKPSFYLIDRDNKKIIDLVKIDTEGSELDILKGMGPIIKNIKIIQFEFGSSNIDSKNFFIEFYIFFTKNNFDIYRITPGIPRKVTYSYFDEVFSTNNYIAVNKSLFKN